MPEAIATQTPLFTEKDPFPRWLRRWFPDLARVDQNPLFAAAYDFSQRRRARMGWFRRRALPWLLLAAGIAFFFWAITSRAMRGPMMPLLINMPVYIFMIFFRKRPLGQKRAFLYDQQLHEVPITARDVLDAAIGFPAIGLKTIIPFILLLSVAVAVAIGVFVPASFPLKWVIVIMAPLVLLSFAHMSIWLQIAALSSNMSALVAVGIGKKAGDGRFMRATYKKVLLRVALIMLAVIAFQGSVAFILNKLSVPFETIVALGLTIVALFCGWQTLFFKGRKVAARRYHWSEALLSVAIPIHIRQLAGDMIDSEELDLLLELFKQPVKKD